MISLFFQISPSDYAEAVRSTTSPDRFALRIVSFQPQGETFVYLPEVTLNELTVFASVLHLTFLPGINSLEHLRQNARPSGLYTVAYGRYY